MFRATFCCLLLSTSATAGQITFSYVAPSVSSPRPDMIDLVPIGTEVRVDYTIESKSMSLSNRVWEPNMPAWYEVTIGGQVYSSHPSTTVGYFATDKAGNLTTASLGVFSGVVWEDYFGGYDEWGFPESDLTHGVAVEDPWDLTKWSITRRPGNKPVPVPEPAAWMLFGLGVPAIVKKRCTVK